MFLAEMSPVPSNDLHNAKLLTRKIQIKRGRQCCWGAGSHFRGAGRLHLTLSLLPACLLTPALSPKFLSPQPRGTIPESCSSPVRGHMYTHVERRGSREGPAAAGEKSFWVSLKLWGRRWANTGPSDISKCFGTSILLSTTVLLISSPAWDLGRGSRSPGVLCPRGGARRLDRHRGSS